MKRSDSGDGSFSSFFRARSDPTIYMNLYQQQGSHNFNVQDMTTNQVRLPAPFPPYNLATELFVEAHQRVTCDNNVMVGSLPNIAGPAAAAPFVYHQTVGQRHSTGACQTLTTPLPLSESQSAPTSPAQSVELPAPTSWPPKNYSNSPESLEIPNIVLTGTDGQLDCFEDLQDLHLDATELQQLLNSGETVDPICESQLLE